MQQSMCVGLEQELQKILHVCPELSRNSLGLAGLLFATGEQPAG